MMKNLLTVMLCFLMIAGMAQSKKEQDIDAILAMCGCYNISFNFAETFGAEKDYEYHDNYYSGGLEWAFPVFNDGNKIIIQHILVINDTMTVKHWRQDWVYENQELYTYDKENNWTYTKLPANSVKGQWTQKVFQVDDSPRYEGSATWVHVDGKHYWESIADAPLPRREFSKRDDYNVMIRKNRHEITEYGWLHEQDNQKVIRGEGDQLLAKEKGWNTYTKTEDSNCQPALNWWKDNKQYWSDVRSVWDQVFASGKDLKLNMKVEDKLLFQRLFAFGDDMAGENYNAKKSKKGILKIIKMHMESDIKLAAK